MTDSSEDAFIGDLFGEDELGVVLRAHTHIEARLTELLDLLVADPEYLKRARLTFGQRVNLAVALGLKPEHAPPLFALGTLRNEFAHQLDIQLSENHVNSLYGTLSPGDREVVQGAYEKTNSLMNRPDMSPFKSLSVKERFILISVALRAMLIVAIREVRPQRSET